jgi:hypothetical protein
MLNPEYECGNGQPQGSHNPEDGLGAVSEGKWVILAEHDSLFKNLLGIQNG